MGIINAFIMAMILVTIILREIIRDGGDEKFLTKFVIAPAVSIAGIAILTTVIALIFGVFILLIILILNIVFGQ